MEGLLPSELARLVYGYLEDLKCSRAAQEFLESCPLLSECLAAHNNGRRIISRVYGQSLQEIINDHCDAHSLIVENGDNLPSHAKDAAVGNRTLSTKIKVLLDIIENRPDASSELNHESSTQPIPRHEQEVSRNTSPNSSNVSTYKQPQSKKNEDPIPPQVTRHEQFVNPTTATSTHNETSVLPNNAQPLAEQKKNQNQCQSPAMNSCQSNSPKLALKTPLFFTPPGISHTTHKEIPTEIPVDNLSNLEQTMAVNEEQNEIDARGSPSKRKTPAKCQKSAGTPSTPSTSKETNFLSPEVFIRPMLQNTQLHEKIAEAINNAMSSDAINNELNATISSVVEQTQSDPVFQRLVDEMFSTPDSEDQTSSSPEHNEIAMQTQTALEYSLNSSVTMQSDGNNTLQFENSLMTAQTSTEIRHHHRHSTSPLHVPVLSFPVTPLGPGTPGTPLGKTTNSLSAELDLNTPDHREIFRKANDADESGGVEMSPKSQEPPLKARLRSSVKKHDPPPVVTSKPSTESSTKRNSKAGGNIAHFAEPQSTAQLPPPSHPVLEENIEVEETSQQEVQQLETVNSQESQECFIVNDVCVEVAPEVQAAISNGSVVLSQANSSRNILELAMSNCDLTSSNCDLTSPTPVSQFISVPVVRQVSQTCHAPYQASLSASKFLVLNQGPLQNASYNTPQNIISSQNIFLPEHGTYVPFIPPNVQRQRQGSRLITIAPKPTIEDSGSISKRRTNRVAKIRTKQHNRKLPDRKLPDRYTTTNKESNSNKERSSEPSTLLNVPRIQQINQEISEAPIAGSLPNLAATPMKSIFSMPSISPLLLPQDFPDEQLEMFNVAFMPPPAQPEPSTSTMEPSISQVEAQEVAPEEQPQPSTSKPTETNLQEPIEHSIPIETDLDKPSQSKDSDPKENYMNKLTETNISKSKETSTKVSDATQKHKNEGVKTAASQETASGSADKAKSPVVNHSSAVRTSYNPRRQSLSTPRRDRNHVRTLDFSTPPRKGATPRRAHTSPKGIGSQRKQLMKARFSPGTAKKLSRAARIVRAGLFQSPESCISNIQNPKVSTVLQTVQEQTVTIKISAAAENFSSSPQSKEVSETVVAEVAPTIVVSSGGDLIEKVTNLSEEHDTSVNTSGSSSFNTSSTSTTSTSSSSSTSKLSSPSPAKSPLKSAALPDNAGSAALVPTASNANESAVFGIATRTPGGPTVTKSCWDKVTGVDLILGSPLTPSPIKPTEPIKKITKDWDSDLRELVSMQSRVSLIESAAKTCDKIVQQKVTEKSKKRKAEAANKKEVTTSDIPPETASSGDDYESPKQICGSKQAQVAKPGCTSSKSSKKSNTNKKSPTVLSKNKKVAPKATTSAKKNISAKKSVPKNTKKIQTNKSSNIEPEKETDGQTATISEVDQDKNPSNQSVTLHVGTEEATSLIKKVVIQSPRTVSKHLVMRNEIQISSTTKSPRKALDMNNLLPTVSQPSSLITPRKLDDATPRCQEETPLTKLLREQPVHELTVIDTPVFPVTPNCDLFDSQCASPPSPNESPYYPPPRDTYDIQYESDTVGVETRQDKPGKTRANTDTRLSQSMSVDIQSARTSRSKTRNEKLNSSNASSEGSVSNRPQVVSDPLTLSIAHLLAAEQDRIGLSKSSKKSKKSKKRSRERSTSVTSRESEAAEYTEVQQPSLPIFTPSPLPDEEVDVQVDFEEEEETLVLQQQKDDKFRELLDEKKHRLMQKLKRDFCKKDTPIVHLRVEGSKSAKAIKRRAQVAKPSTSKTATKKSLAKLPAKKQPSNTVVSHCDAPGDTAKEKTCSLPTPVSEDQVNLSEASSDDDLPSATSIRKETLLTVTEHCETDQLTGDIIENTQTEVLSNVEIETTIIESQPRKTEVIQQQNIVQASPGKLRALSISPRKSFSVDEIANRLRSAVGMSEDEDMPPLVFQDSPVKLNDKNKQLPNSKTSQNLLQQLELSPISLKAKILQRTQNSAQKTSSNNISPPESQSIVSNKESDLASTEIVSDIQSSMPINAPTESVAASDTPSNLHNNNPVTENVAVIDTVSDITPLSKKQTTPIDTTENTRELQQPPSDSLTCSATPATEKNEQDQSKSVAESSQPTHSPQASSSQGSNTPVPETTVQTFKRIGYYSTKHDPNKTCPTYVPDKTKSKKKLAISMLVDEDDGKGEQMKVVTLSYTATHELLEMLPLHPRINLTASEHRPSSSQHKSVEHRSSSRQYYSSHRDSLRNTSHKDKRSRSPSPNKNKSKYSHESSSSNRYNSKHSARSRNSRSSSNSRSSTQNVSGRKHRSRSRSYQRSQERSKRKDNRHSGDKDERDRGDGRRPQNKERGQQDKEKNEQDRSRKNKDRYNDEENAKNQSNLDQRSNTANEICNQESVGSIQIADISQKSSGSSATDQNKSRNTNQEKTHNMGTTSKASTNNEKESFAFESTAKERSKSPCFSPEESPGRSSSSSSSSSSDSEEENQHLGRESPPNLEDELMTYALVGSERVSEPCSFTLHDAPPSPNLPVIPVQMPSSSKPTKRKGSNLQSLPLAKKLKDNPQEMLREVGLDNLLSALHGDKDP